MKDMPGTIILAEDETWPDYKVADLTRLLHMGATMATLKKQLHTSARAIVDRIERYKLPPLREGGKRGRSWQSFSADEIGDIRDMRDRGVPNADIVAKYGISLTSLDNLRARYGFGKKTTKYTLGKRVSIQYNPLSESELDEVADLYGKGVLTSNICELFAVDPKVVYRVAKYRGVSRPDNFPMDGTYHWSEPEREHLRMLASRGVGSVEIGDELGVDKETVKHEAARLGIALPDRYAVIAARNLKKYAEIDPQVLRMRLAGMQNSEIAEQMGLTIGRVNASVARLVERSLAQRRQASPWRPKRGEVAVIVQGYRLHLRPITIAMRLGADSEHSILRVARDEAISHPCFGRPQFHVIRPEVLLHHMFDGRIDKHLDDVEVVFRRSLEAKDIDKALSRFEKARKEFPELTPWGHPDIKARAAEMRARDRNSNSVRTRLRTADVKQVVTA